MRGAIRIIALCLFLMPWAQTLPARSAEGAAGFYLLGSKAQMAGVLPPPGLYIQNIAYFYSGDTDAALEIAGVEVAGGVEADVFYDLASAVYVLPERVLGGNFALSLIVPIAWKDVSAGIELTGPLGAVLGTSVEDNQGGFGDPVPGAVLGWHRGNWHWNLGVLVNVPVGVWREGNIASLGFNRVGIDTSAAATWLDPEIGLDISVAAGVTYNFENPDTDYKTGTEFHAEWAVMQNFSPAFALGISGYHYNQVTGDSGRGARLGEFQGRTTAIGPMVNANFSIGRVPVSAAFRYLFELETRNRLSGEAALLTITIPLLAASPSTSNARARFPVSPNGASGRLSSLPRPVRPPPCYNGPHSCRY